jgi:hypothetical protein
MGLNTLFIIKLTNLSLDKKFKRKEYEELSYNTSLLNFYCKNNSYIPSYIDIFN